MAVSLECGRCGREFRRRAQIASGQLDLDTMICGYCYALMQSTDIRLCCFGKPTEILLSDTRLLGYNPLAEECRAWCPDRAVCKRVVSSIVPKEETSED